MVWGPDLKEWDTDGRDGAFGPVARGMRHPARAPAMRALERAAGGLSLFAGLVHADLGPAHFRVWWGYGLFFAVAALAQLLLGLALLLDALDPARLGPSLPRLKRAMYASGIVGNALLIGLYVLTRTWGIPLFGPAAGGIERVAPLDVATEIAQAGTIALLATLLARTPKGYAAR